MRSDQKEARDRYTEIIKHRSRDSQPLGWKPGDRSNTALMNKFQIKKCYTHPQRSTSSMCKYGTSGLVNSTSPKTNN